MRYVVRQRTVMQEMRMAVRCFSVQWQVTTLEIVLVTTNYSVWAEAIRCNR